jgi:hypothetical protein
MLGALAPNVAIALRETGSDNEADYLLATTSARLEDGLKQVKRSDDISRLGRIRATQGNRAEAIALLDWAVRSGWFPDGRTVAIDLEQEPAYHGLRGDPRFEALRKRILDHVAKERAELGPLTV